STDTILPNDSQRFLRRGGICTPSRASLLTGLFGSVKNTVAPWRRRRPLPSDGALERTAVDRSSVNVAMCNHQAGAPPVGTHLDCQEPPFDAVEAVDFRILSGSAAGVGIAGGPAAEFFDARLRVDGVILPVAVAAEHEGVFPNIIV